jgi:hypothetical protein
MEEREGDVGPRLRRRTGHKGRCRVAPVATLGTGEREREEEVVVEEEGVVGRRRRRGPLVADAVVRADAGGQ